MTKGRSKCRAIRESTGAGCRGHVDVIVKILDPERTEHPQNPRWKNVGLCKFHCQLWLNHLADPEGVPAVRYKPHTPPVIEELV